MSSKKMKSSRFKLAAKLKKTKYIRRSNLYSKI